jgi:basic membrane protein A and related proteins
MTAIWLIVMVSILATAVPVAAGAGTEALKVGFIYIGPVGDYGWSQAHDQGCKHLEAAVPDVKTTYVEPVPEWADAERVLTQLARSGHKVIVATSYGYMDTMLKVAERFPTIVFLHCSGHKRRANMGTYFGRMYQASYLTGLVAGQMTQQKRIGYIAPIPIPEVIRITNAFALGVRAVNSEVNVHVVWTNAWYDPATDEWWPIGTGIMSLSPFGPAVSDPIKSRVERRKQDLIAGQFAVFWGPIKD